MNKRWMIAPSLVAAATLSACSAENMNVGVGGINTKQLRSAFNVGKTVVKAMEELPPDKEYFVGRGVSANLMDQYNTHDDAALNTYVNQVGQSLAMASDRPELYHGYVFQVLKSKEVNAFASPGGHVFVTTGLLKACKSEDELAAVLGHEIGHIEAKHGVKSIKSSRWTQAALTAATEAGKHSGNEQTEVLANAMEGSVNDVVKTLVEKGYSRDQEYAADKAAIKILSRIGYDPSAMVRVLETLAKDYKAGGLGFMKTHPSPKDRIASVKAAIAEAKVAIPKVRVKRFTDATKGL